MKFSSGEKKWLAFSVVAIALPLGVGLFLNRINATPVVNIPAYPRAPKPNGYDLYVTAAQLTTRLKPEPDPISDVNRPTDAKESAQRYSLARKTAWLNQNQQAFSLFDQALQTPSLAPPQRSFRAFGSGQSKLRQLARDKTIQSNARWMRGDGYGALQSGLDIVQLGHDVRRGGVLIGDLVGIAIGAIGRSATSDTIERINADQAKSAARRLEKLLQTRWSLSDALTEEKYSTQASLLETFRTEPGWRKSFAGKLKLDSWRYYTISKQQIIDDIGADFDRRIKNARLSYAQKGAPPAEFNDPMMKFFQSDGERQRLSEARDLIGDRLLMMRLALRAYRLENGAYPPKLDALVPAYLSAVPADPFGGGEALRYQSDGKTYALWSIGPDGVDDGGAPIPSRKRSTRASGERPYGMDQQCSFDAKGDFVVSSTG